jgi:hypothetical protein
LAGLSLLRRISRTAVPSLGSRPVASREHKLLSPPLLLLSLHSIGPSFRSPPLLPHCNCDASLVRRSYPTPPEVASFRSLSLAFHGRFISVGQLALQEEKVGAIHGLCAYTGINKVTGVSVYATLLQFSLLLFALAATCFGRTAIFKQKM